VAQDSRIDRTHPSAAQLLALSLPTWVFAGYDLARRSFLAAYLSYDLGLPIAVVGWLVMFAGLASIPAELVAGALCDRGSRRLGARIMWMASGTALLVAGGVGLLLLGRSGGVFAIAAALFALVVGWAVCNVTHGAWALDATADAAARARVFGLRSLTGILGGVAFSLLAVMQTGRALSPFAAILLAVTIGAPLAHALLIALVPDRAAASRPWRRDLLLDPVRLLFANRGNRRLAALFALNGAHTAITGTGYLYLVGNALALPGWGATGILVQASCAAIGIGITVGFGTRWPAERTLRAICWINLLLAITLVALPPGRPALLMLWTAAFGLVSAIDFMALRVLLGARLDLATRAATGRAPAAAYYAGFHLPFNLCGAIAAGMLLFGYRLAGFDPAIRHGTEQAFVSALLMPAACAAGLMAASLFILRTPGDPTPEQRLSQESDPFAKVRITEHV
jgi:Na+/melibiose symporter-like transporter